MKTTTKTPIKNNLSKYRHWKDLTQKELAEELEISASLIVKIENDVPKWYTRKMICEYFGVSQGQMFYREDD
jgi:DNA-binding XRE family transcriptional regulator